MRHSKIDFLEKRPYTETTHSKADREFQAKLGLYGKNRFAALKQHWRQEVKFFLEKLRILL